MAKVKAPLLSLGASGKIAGTLVASTWKGLKTMREYVVPSNPKTAAQVAHRAIFTLAVAAWRNYLVIALMRTAWNRSALASGKPQSGFNAAMKSLVGIIVSNPDASYASTAVAGAADTIDFTMVNADDGTTGDEAGTFEVWSGSAPGSLLLISDSETIAAGVINSGDLGTSGDVVYCKLRKDSFDRSGIVKITLAA